MSAILFQVLDIVAGAELRIVEGEAEPRSAVLIVVSRGRRHGICIINPRPLESLVKIFDECYEFRLVDQNADGANQLEYGRYRLEIRDEDGLVAEAIADAYEIIAAF
jgi:hypothetical protein